MHPTEDLRIRAMSPIVAPEDLKRVFPLTPDAAAFVSRSREAILDVLYGRSPRLLAVVGPCSIHHADAALDYARRLAALARELEEQLLVVMRVYFEKPRTTVGWKGLINDPDLDGTHRISKGLGIARRLLCEITELGLPVATETLGPINPQYLADLISWGCIGARTSESQIHREMVSGLSFPVGIKNSTDGNLKHALDALKAVGQPHSFLGITHGGRAAIVQTAGNPDVHIVLRGGEGRPNYAPGDVARTEDLLRAAGVRTGILVDCSHANSGKDPSRQPEVLASVVRQVAEGSRSLCGFMVEGNLETGSQPVPADPRDLRYGVSITDACLDWGTTETALRGAHETLRRCGRRHRGR
ncbi:MAG: 3-deoxy-7-phosphoheptulonate synthase [Deferrisomatales bacterium]